MNQPEMQISRVTEEIPQALSIYINQIVYDQKRKGKDITTLSLGEAFFDIPMFDFGKLDFVRGYHYSDSQGIPPLRQKIVEFYKKEYNADIDPNKEVLVTAGSKPVIFMAFQATLNAGDEVLIHEPGWLSYQEQVRLVGGVPKFIPYQCSVADFHTHFTEKTRMVVINNPNNPAGRIYTKEELHSLYQQCRSRGIYVMVDEAYSDFILDGDEFYSMARVKDDKDGIIVVNSLSKNMGMSGWRVGYVVTHSDLLKQILKLNQHIITCAPTILQYYMAEYFDEVTSITLPQVREVVEKRQRVGQLIADQGLKSMGGSSTFYYFVDIEDFPSTSLNFALHLLLFNQVAVVPGSAYGASTERFVRVSIGTESEERINDALMMMSDLIHTTEFNDDELHSRMNAENIGVFKAR